MKKIVRSLLLFLTIAFISCGEDRSGEYYAIVADRVWIEELMREVYLWYEDIPEEKELKYLTDPVSFFNSLRTKTGLNGKPDKFSTMKVIESEGTRAEYLSTYTETYGMQCKLYKSKNSTKYYYALVLYVLPGSPAEEAGIKRGDWIGKINEKEIESSHEELLYTGGKVSFELNRLKIKYKEDKKEEEEGEKNKEEEREIESYEWVRLDEVDVSAARSVEQTPYIAKTVIKDKELGAIGYLAYTNFALLNEKKENLYNDEYIKQMVDIFRNFKSENIQKLILDLRYNPGGYLDCSHVLASLIAPEESMGELFCSVVHSDKRTSDDRKYPLTTSITEGVNLNLHELYVITSEETASASEVLINCLSPYMKITTVGATTVGKNVASQQYTSEEFPKLLLYPIVAYIKDKNDEIKYDGIKPDFEGVEFTLGTDSILHALGDLNEKLLYNTIYVIKNGKLPGQKDEEKKEVKASATKRRLNQLEGIILN